MNGECPNITLPVLAPGMYSIRIKGEEIADAQGTNPSNKK